MLPVHGAQFSHWPFQGHCCFILRFTLAVTSPPSGWDNTSDSDAERLRAHLEPLALPPFVVRATLAADQVLQVALHLPSLPGPELEQVRAALDAQLRRPSGAADLAGALMRSTSCTARLVGEVECRDHPDQLALREPALRQEYQPWPEPDSSVWQQSDRSIRQQPAARPYYPQPDLSSVRQPAARPYYPRPDVVQLLLQCLLCFCDCLMRR